MRKWLLAGGVTLLVVAGIVAFALANLGRFLERNREWIAAQASHAVGRAVHFDEIGVSLRGGIAARLGKLRVAEDPAYGTEDFLRAKDVRVSVRLLPALLGRYEIGRVIVDAPSLTVIRDAKGLSLASLGRGGGAEGGKPSPEGAPASSGPPAGLLVSELALHDGQLRYVDRTVTPPREVTVARLDVEASDVSVAHPVKLRVAAAVLGDRQNVRAEGTVGPLGPAMTAGGDLPVDLTLRLDDVPPYHASGTITAKAVARRGTAGVDALTGTVTLRDLAATPPGAPWALKGLSSTVELRGGSAVVPPTRFELGGVPFQAEGTVEPLTPPAGRFVVRADEVPLRPLGFAGEGVQKTEVVKKLETTGTASLAGGEPVVQANVRSPSGSVRDADYQDLQMDVGLHGTVATLDRLHVGAFEGTCETSGHYDMTNAEQPRFDLRSAVHGMALRALLAGRAPGAASSIDGRLEATLALSGAGKARPAIERSLAGQGRVDVKDGVLKDVNLADGVFGGTTGIAGLSALVPPNIRTKYPEIFGGSDTRFDELGADVRIGDRRITTDNARLAARDYAVDGRGWVSFDREVDFTATLVASQRLTGDIVGAAKEARYVTNDSGRLAIPFRLAGTLPKVRPMPDTEFLARALGKAAVGSGVDKLIDQLGGKKKGGKEKPEQELLRKGLQGLFGK